jgi:hypothetical protein
MKQNILNPLLALDISLNPGLADIHYHGSRKLQAKLPPMAIIVADYSQWRNGSDAAKVLNRALPCKETQTSLLPVNSDHPDQRCVA